MSAALKETFEEHMGEWADAIESALDDMTRLPDAPQTLVSAMRYSLLGGGKRLRGAMLLAACESFGGSRDEAMTYACALECIHCFSLIHDDLPAMDNDDTRRGKPSNHIAYGEGMALLAGDALLAFAAERMLQAALQRSDDPARMQAHVMAAHTIMAASSVQGIAGGQCMDLEGMESPKWRDGDAAARLEWLSTLHIRKTAAMFQAAVVAGFTLAGATDDEINTAYQFGSMMGIAFQIRDDILDIEGDPAQMGKRTGMDVNKCTWPNLQGLDVSKATADALEQEALAALASLGDRGALLAGFIDLMHGGS